MQQAEMQLMFWIPPMSRCRFFQAILVAPYADSLERRRGVAVGGVSTSLMSCCNPKDDISLCLSLEPSSSLRADSLHHCVLYWQAKSDIHVYDTANIRGFVRDPPPCATWCNKVEVARWQRQKRRRRAEIPCSHITSWDLSCRPSELVS